VNNVLFKKKGALQLSINAIVVLILAITILGLALTFITSMFESSMGDFDKIDEEQKAEAIAKLTSSNKLLTFKSNKMEVTSGNPQDFYFAVRNTAEDDSAFYFYFVCDQAKTGSCSSGTGGTKWDFFDYQECVKLDGKSSEAFLTRLLGEGSRNEYMGKFLVYQWKTEDCKPDYIGNYSTLDAKIASNEVGLSKYASEDIYVNVKQ
jgi:hypothetical protein